MLRKYTETHQSHVIAEQLKVTVHKSQTGLPVHNEAVKANVHLVFCATPT